MTLPPPTLFPFSQTRRLQARKSCKGGHLGSRLHRHLQSRSAHQIRMRFLRWFAIDGNRVLNLETTAMFYLFFSSLLVGTFAILLRALVGWTELAATYLFFQAAIFTIVSVAAGGLEVGQCGGPIFASHFGLASGFSLVLGYGRRSDSLHVQGMAGTVLCLTVALGSSFIVPQPPKLPIFGTPRWTLDTHSLYWNFRMFWASGAAGCFLSSFAHWAIEAGEMTLRVPSFEESEVLPFRRFGCQANPRGSGCSANNPIDITVMVLLYGLAAVVCAEQSVRQRRREVKRQAPHRMRPRTTPITRNIRAERQVLGAQRRDRAMRGDFEDAYGEDAAWEGSWRRALGGHRCITAEERDGGANGRGELMYGELSPAGARYLGGMEVMDLGSKEGGSVVDVGMGAGKVALQWFLEHQSLGTVVGVERVESRFRLAEAACVKLAGNSGGRFCVEGAGGARVEMVEEGGRGRGRRRLKLVLGEAWEAAGSDLAGADACLVNLFTEGGVVLESLVKVFGEMKAGCKVVSYGSLECGGLIERGRADALTSWSNEYGHSFAVYELAGKSHL